MFALARTMPDAPAPVYFEFEVGACRRWSRNAAAAFRFNSKRDAFALAMRLDQSGALPRGACVEVVRVGA